MRPMTREEVRGAFVNPDPTAKKIRLPAWFDDVPWHQIDYLGWRDLRAPQLAYLVTEADDQALGVLLRQAPNRAELESRAVMCDLCRSSRRFNEVSRFTARRPSRDKRERLNVLGLLLCTDLDCAVKVSAKPIRQGFGLEDGDRVEERREGLRARTVAFIRSVADTERITQHRG
ncbi:hypothetical protein HMPREF1486_04571 [Streptomyces sp. HPH0547]|uniref:FBP domain-containing protein n=2 Tax=Streptomyces TaxID=1883 RepID=A0A8H1LIY0_9ACTN|nr:hypothetical protein HMPREF1486_04571 [Streptomyces sp. HPH0547]TGG86251.1 FBP domain-containing protein [Streptomyces albus]GHJ24267.1 hypothetical protein TPA0909_58810 [Streptomyces albus]